MRSALRAVACGLTLTAGAGLATRIPEASGAPAAAPPAARTLTGHQGPVHAVAFSPDGMTLATAGDDRTVRLWEVERARPQPDGEVPKGTPRPPAPRTLEGARSPLRAIAFSPGRGGPSPRTSSRPGTPAAPLLLAGGCEDGAVLLWDCAGGELRATLTGHRGAVASIAFSPDGKILASGSRDGTVRLWEDITADRAERDSDRPKETSSRVLRGHRDWVSAVVFSPSGKTLLSGDAEAVRLWDPRRGDPKGALPGPLTHWILLPADGTVLAVGSFHSDTVRFWDTKSFEPRPELKTGERYLKAAALSPDGLVIAGGAAPRLPGDPQDSGIWLWTVPAAGGKADPEPLLSLPGHRGGVLALAFSPDGRLLASGGADGAVRIWDLVRARMKE